MDALVGQTLVAVKRLSWTEPTGSSDPKMGPIHLHFEEGRGAFLSGQTDFALGVLLTQAGDDSWLLPYQYDVDGSRWVLREATEEQPWEGLRGARLNAWESIRNEMGEQVGVTLVFDAGTISLRLYDGEVAT